MTFAAMLVVCGYAAAAELRVEVSDQRGNAAANAVVGLAASTSLDGAPEPSGDGRPRIVDQINETFVPLVTVIRRGDEVVFKNSERTRHHVYSFSRIKPFQLELQPGQASEPVRFDQPGAAAIGCNIHDPMLAYIYVTDAPWAEVTDAEGRAVFADLPSGDYVARIWHPRLKSAARPEARPVTVGTGNASLNLSVSLFAEPSRNREHKHDY